MQRILDTAEIVDVVSDYVSLKRRGSGYIGLCPFHNERTPSFSVSPAKGICKCFSCGKGGSPVNFIMELEKMTYQEALRHLAGKYNIEIEERELTDKEREEETERASMTAVNEWALKFFETTLADTPEGRDVGKAYFLERGVSEAMIKRFHLGYSPEKGDSLYRAAIKQGYVEKYLISTGLCAKSERNGSIYDRFRGRVIYPVHSVAGKVVAFGGRTLRSDKTMAKYVNSPESIIYSKSHQLYGLYQARNSIVNHDKCFLVEGYMDVISMYQSGVENVVASSGTSLTTGQIRLLRRFTTNVTVVYDSDPAGIKASLRGVDLLLAEGMNVKVLQFPDGDDPDSYAQHHTSAELVEYIGAHEVDFIRFKASILLEDAQSDPLKRAGAISSIVASIAAIPELIKRTVYIAECGRMFGIDEQVIALQVADNIARNIENEKTERRRREGRQDIGELPRDTTADANAASKAATPAAAGSQGDRRQAYLEPRERQVLRYVLKYGMSEIKMIGEEGDKSVELTVLDYVIQEMEYDSLSFASHLVARVFNAARGVVDEGWSRAYEEFLRGLDAEVEARRREGHDRIRSSIVEMNQLHKEDAKLEEEVAAYRAAKIAEFRAEYIWRILMSSDDDGVRDITTSLVTERYRLSAIHTRYGTVATEADRLDELVPRAVNEWKLGVLDVDISEVNENIRKACEESPSGDSATLRELMAEKCRLLELKREFSRFLGDRIYAPWRLR